MCNRFSIWSRTSSARVEVKQLQDGRLVGNELECAMVRRMGRNTDMSLGGFSPPLSPWLFAGETWMGPLLVVSHVAICRSIFFRNIWGLSRDLQPVHIQCTVCGVFSEARWWPIFGGARVAVWSPEHDQWRGPAQWRWDPWSLRERKPWNDQAEMRTILSAIGLWRPSDVTRPISGAPSGEIWPCSEALRQSEFLHHQHWSQKLQPGFLRHRGEWIAQKRLGKGPDLRWALAVSEWDEGRISRSDPEVEACCGSWCHGVVIRILRRFVIFSQIFQSILQKQWLLRKEGAIRSVMCTGDSELTGIAIGKQCGIVTGKCLRGSVEDGRLIFSDPEKEDEPATGTKCLAVPQREREREM